MCASRGAACASQAAFRRRQRAVEEATATLDAVTLSTTVWNRQGLRVSQDGTYKSAATMLGSGAVTLAQVGAAVRAALGHAHADAKRMAALVGDDGDGVTTGEAETAAIECYYRPHVAQQQVRTAGAHSCWLEGHRIWG